MSDSGRLHRRQPTRLSRPWYSPGKNTGVGCHFLLQCMKVKSESEVPQLSPTLRDPMDSSLPVSSVRGIFQARVLEWGAIAFSRVIVYEVSNSWIRLSVTAHGLVWGVCVGSGKNILALKASKQTNKQKPLVFCLPIPDSDLLLLKASSIWRSLFYFIQYSPSVQMVYMTEWSHPVFSEVQIWT